MAGLKGTIVVLIGALVNQSLGIEVKSEEQNEYVLTLSKKASHDLFGDIHAGNCIEDDSSEELALVM